MRSLLLLAALASCAKGGVEIIVTPNNPAVTRVTLYVGVGDVMTEPLQPASSSPLDPILAYARDRGGEADVRDTVDRAPVTFQYVDGDKFPIVIAVGTDLDGLPISAAVIQDVKFTDGAIARYEVELHPTLAERPDAFIKVMQWESMAGPAAGKQCVVYEDKPTLKRWAVVTDGDPDCDGWPTGDEKECQPQLYMSYGRPTLDEVACLAPERVPNIAEDLCALGGPPCTDSVGKETACRAASVYCLPRSVCETCAAQPASFDCARNLADLPATTVKPTHLRCDIYVEDATGKPCPMLKALGPLADSTIAGRTCIVDTLHPPRITQRGKPWGNTVSFTGETGNQLTIEIKNLVSNCNFDVIASGQIESPQEFSAMVAGDLDNGRGIAFPVIFSVDPQRVGCFNQAPCAVAWPFTNDRVDVCVNAVPFPPETTN